MQTLTRTIAVAALYFPVSVLAGVEMVMVTTDAAGNPTDRSTIYAQSNMIRMDEAGAQGGSASMIFRDNEFMYLDHDDKSYFVMDEAMIDSVSSQMDEAMKQMQEQLASLPPEQRAMAEQMMKGRLEGMMGQSDAAAPRMRVESLGRGEWRSNACRNYAVFEGNEKTQEVCAADLDSVPGADQAMGAFRDMAAYVKKLTESLPAGAGGGVNPGELMDQIDGFPVLTRQFINGNLYSEFGLESSTETSVDPALFAPPADYSRKNPF